ncbi:hypothetical protein QFC21_006952 [Naganishia friedmannii]|uniref:Uncharacterized protein n=1 Tax=Naganishia friedmannii TaxID=89922 RepID=A0ACC2V010_9TREE|nr:hypothetical protein QFC21_006952 [Naganishia friedmannii]
MFECESGANEVDAKTRMRDVNITFLKSCETDHSVPEDSIESLQVASQCLSDAFGVDPDSAEDVEKYDLGAGKGLMDVWGIVRGVAAKRGEDGDAAKGKTSASKDTSPTAKETAKDATTASSTNKEPAASDKSQAEALKAEGNALITRRLYSSAIEKYTAAIALDPGNAVYYSNRAAAWGAMGEHAEAVTDAEEAVKRDPGFGRGWSRLGVAPSGVTERMPSSSSMFGLPETAVGHAQYSLGNYSEAVKAYTQGLTIDPANANMQQALAQAKAKEAAQQATQANDSDEDAEDGEVTRAGGAPAAGGRAGGAGGMPDLSSMADLLGSLGGGGNGTGGPGGMPDLAGLMSNPAIMQMAQSMMANGGLDKLMSNPAMRNMAERMSGGGGMPDMDALRNDPEMRNLASQFMGGQGGPGQ